MREMGHRGRTGGSLARALTLALLSVGFSALALPASVSATADVDLAATPGITFDGAAAEDASGAEVRPAGDVNDDGREDLIIGANLADPQGRADAGAAYVIYGRATPANVDLAALGSDGFVIQGAAASDTAGTTVTSAGDANGDGIDDVAVGAPGSNAGGALSGAAYVIYGESTPDLADVDLLQLPGSARGYRIVGGAAGDGLGFAASVSLAGDVNSDGRADLVMGAPYTDPLSATPPSPRSFAGTTYVIYGGTNPDPADLDLTDVAAGGPADGRGFQVIGAAVDNIAGFPVNGAGDANADGIDDVMIGAQGENAGGVSAGAVYVVYGENSADPADLDLADLTGSADSRGYRILGAEPDDFTSGGSGGMRLNGDAFEDLVVGAIGADPLGRSAAGAAFVVYGTGTADPPDLDLGELGGAADSRGYRIFAPGAGDQAAFAPRPAGDINGDGRDDLIVDAYISDPFGRPEAGAVYIVYGSADLDPDDLDLAQIRTSEDSRGLEIAGAEGSNIASNFGDSAGYSTSGVGDRTGDGRDDILVGAAGADPQGREDAGRSYLLSFIPSATGGPPLSFGDQSVGSQGAGQEATLFNGDPELWLNVDSLDLVGADAGQFARGADDCTGARLAPGEHCAAAIAFAPSSRGAKTAAARFSHDGTAGTSDVGLAGTGRTPALAASNQEISFGPVDIGAVSGIGTVRFTGGNQDPVTISATSVQGADADEFRVESDGCAGRTLAAGEACDVSLSFRPLDVGSKSAALVLATDGGPSQVALSGVGREPIPPPIAGDRGIGSVESGVVVVKKPGESSFREFTPGELVKIPVGSVVDTTAGEILLVSERDRKTHAVRRGRFSQGAFRFVQEEVRRPLTELTLVGGGACTETLSKSRKRGSKLFGKAGGGHRTNGAYGSATVRGTQWLTEDVCGAGGVVVATRVSTVEGKVQVRDRQTGRVQVVRAGDSATVRAR